MPYYLVILNDLLLGAAGKIIDAILKANYFISDLQLFQLDRANAEEFIEVYKGILPEYHVISFSYP
jgi:nucleoside-diphosphate kinase